MVCPEHIDPPELPVPVEVVSAEGKTVIPGYVDQHVHVIGGGGEAGPYSRTSEVHAFRCHNSWRYHRDRSSWNRWNRASPGTAACKGAWSGNRRNQCLYADCVL